MFQEGIWSSRKLLRKSRTAKIEVEVHARPTPLASMSRDSLRMAFAQQLSGRVDDRFAPVSSSKGKAMRFAITGCDRYLGIFEAFVRAGWRPLRLFTSHVTSELDNQRRVTAFA